MFITAEGLLMYLQPDEAMELIRQCAKRFPGGQMFFDLPPTIVKKVAPKGMRASKHYRVPPMPFSLSINQLRAAWSTPMPGLRAVHDVPMPAGRGFFFEKVFPAIWRFGPARTVPRGLRPARVRLTPAQLAERARRGNAAPRRLAQTQRSGGVGVGVAPRPPSRRRSGSARATKVP